MSKPVDHQPRSTTWPRPKEGSQPKVTAKTRMSTMPVTKVGCRNANQRHGLNEARGGAVGPESAEDAERDAERKRQDGRDDHQFQGRRQALGDQLPSPDAGCGS